MMPMILMVILLIMFLLWEYNFSRPAKLFKALRIKEPETYNLLCKNKLLYPSLTIKGIIANNQYEKIKSIELRKELLDIDETESKHSVILVYVIIAYLLLNLLF